MRVLRRTVLATAGGTLAAAAWARKPLAEEDLPPIAEALKPVAPPQSVPDAPFLDSSGAAHRLADFKGRGMVVNLWATWCAPCVAEMPSLETLSKALAPHDIAVLPLSSDRGGASVVQAWFNSHGVNGLPILLDPKGALSRAFNARGIPTTLIVNTSSLVVARLEGAANWASPEAQKLVRTLIAG